ncbi:MAG: hypothetical protein MJ078_02660, partial [Clostridia bacterium]|nr:hypothetical protein [Clostridia bacterium]
GKDGELAGLIEANKTAIDKVQTGLKDYVDGEVAKLVAADAKNLEDLTKMINDLSKELKEKDSELEGKIAANTQAIEDVKTRVDGIDGEIAALKEQTGKLGEEDTRLAGLIKSNDDAIKAALEQAKTDINGLIASKVEELQGADTKNLADLTKMINDLSAQVEAKNSELAGKIADNKVAIEKVAKDLADLDAKLAESKAELENKDKQIEDNISTFVTVTIIVGSVFLISIAALYVLVLKKKKS